jgi:dedicator of cytokinesis protein 3
MLYSMIVSEYHVSQHFDNIENELVSKLDQLFMSDSKGDDISRAFFIGHLRHLFESSTVDEGLRDRVANFLDSVDLFLELLLSVRALPEGEEFADDRVIATVRPYGSFFLRSYLPTRQLRLMNFIRRIGRDEIYIKYVHQLVNVSLVSGFRCRSVTPFVDAFTISKLRRSRVDAEAAFGSPRVGPPFFRRSHGRSRASSAVSIP